MVGAGEDAAAAAGGIQSTQDDAPGRARGCRLGWPARPRPALLNALPCGPLLDLAVSSAGARRTPDLTRPHPPAHDPTRHTLLCPPCSPCQSALRPELLSALKARGTVFLGQGEGVVEGYCRGVIASEQTEDNFYV